MALVWDDTRKLEVSSADLNVGGLCLLDGEGNGYVLDGENGLVDMSEEGGGCKNLGFRRLWNGEQTTAGWKGINVSVMKEVTDTKPCRLMKRELLGFSGNLNSQ